MKQVVSKLALSAAVAATSIGTWAAELEEVLVTAQKRTESLQDVPISVTAISGEQIQDASIRGLGDLGAYVPNFSVTENAVNTIITMRGISVGAQQSFEQSVGMFVDGVHYGKSRQARLGLFDLEQVEVLRGPQGTLFGKNTLAGAINVRTAAPKVGEGLSGRVAASFESDNGKYFEGYVSGSLSDNFAMRLAIMDREIDGYLDNTSPNAWGNDMPSTDETIARIGAQWEPSDQTTLALRYTYSDFVRQGGTATVTTFQPLPNAPASNAAMYATMGLAFPTFQASSNDTYRDGYSIGGAALSGSDGAERLEGTDTQNHEFSVNFEHEFDNGMTFAAVTGVSSYEYEDGIDADFLPVEFIGRSDDSEYEQFSQEIRLSSDPSKRFSWVAGANYIDSKQEIDRLVDVRGSLGQPDVMRLITCPVPQLLGACGIPTFLAYSGAQLAGIEASLGLPPGSLPPGVEGLSMYTDVARLSRWVQDTESWAVFLQGTFDLTETLSITAGLRYTEETKKVSARTDITTGSTGIMNPVPPSVNPLLHGLMGASFDSYAHEFNEERDTDQLMPAGSINWRPADDHLLYVSYAEGFKSGGFNSVDDQNPIFLPDGTILRDQPGVGFEYDDETAWSVEFGGKHTFLDGSLRVNWNYFNSEYDDQQVSTFVGLGFVVANAASTEISGFEVDAAWQATDKLRLNLAFGYIDGEYGSFPGAGCTALQQDALRGLNITDSSAPVTSVTVDGRTCEQKFLGNGAPSGASQDLSGADLGSAEYSGSFGAEFVQPIGAMAWFTQLDVNFTDDYFMTGDLDPIDVQAGFETVNIRTGLRGDSWMLMFYGRNIGDERFATGAFDIPLASGSHGRYQARGEVWGVQAAWEF